MFSTKKCCLLTSDHCERGILVSKCDSTAINENNAMHEDSLHGMIESCMFIFCATVIDCNNNNKQQKATIKNIKKLCCYNIFAYQNATFAVVAGQQTTLFS